MAMRKSGKIRLADWGTLRKLLASSSYCIEVVDARNPVGTRSGRLERMCESLGVELIIAVNKIDLVPQDIVWGWVRGLEERTGFTVLPISARHRIGTLRLRKRLRKLSPQGTGVVVGMVAGVPKTGKSTLINVLRGRHGASTSPVPGSPGYTKGFTLYRVEGRIYLYDTPGVVPDAMDPLERIIRLYPPEHLPDPLETAVRLIKRVLEHNPTAFIEAYGIEEEDPYKLLEKLALSRGWVEKRSGDPMVEQAAVTVIRDYHEGKIRFYIPPPW